MGNTKICGLDSTEIETLKQKHGALVAVTVSYQEKKYQVIFKEPTFTQMEAMKSVSENNEIKAAQSAFINYKVVADKEIELRDMLKIKAIEALMLRVTKTTADAKNL